MTPAERSLRALQAQAQFELAEVATAVAQAAHASECALAKASAFTQRCEDAASSVRAALTRAQIDAPLVDATHRIHHAEHRALRTCNADLAVARRHERQLRDTLAFARSRERSIERALKAEQRKQAAKRRARESIIDDELWLQRSWSETA
jgi:hypothetical protein